MEKGVLSAQYPDLDGRRRRHRSRKETGYIMVYIYIRERELEKENVEDIVVNEKED